MKMATIVGGQQCQAVPGDVTRRSAEACSTDWAGALCGPKSNSPASSPLLS